MSGIIVRCVRALVWPSSTVPCLLWADKLVPWRFSFVVCARLVFFAAGWSGSRLEVAHWLETRWFSSCGDDTPSDFSEEAGCNSGALGAVCRCSAHFPPLGMTTPTPATPLVGALVVDERKDQKAVGALRIAKLREAKGGRCCVTPAYHLVTKRLGR